MKGSMISEKAGKKTAKTRKENVLDLSGKGLQNMSSLSKNYSTCDLILDNNSITKIEKLNVFPELSMLSMVGNRLVRMNGINFAKNLKSVDLSNNGIVSMEGLCWLVHLEYLDLSKNNIKCIQNVSYCTKLKHMDLSENSITEISNLKSLVQLEVLLLHGNAIKTLEKANEKLPDSIETFSLSGNGIPDLNEIHYLSCLLGLKQFSIMDNPCVMTTLSLPVFNFRLFTLSCLPSLLTLDGSVVTDTQRQEAERLRRDRDLALFTFGNHLQLVLYLSKIYPLSDSAKISDDQSDFLEDFLRKRRTEIFGDPKDVYDFGGGNIKSSDSLQSSSYSILDFSEMTRNASENFSLDQENDTDTLRSESRFLPVLSPQKNSPRTDRRQFQTCLSWEVSPPSDAGDQSTMSEDLPIMSEEEANKLIDLAATILQSHIRGFLVRRKFDYRHFKKRHTAASKIQALWRGYYFRRYSNQSLNFRNEVRVKRLQKYISTLFSIMQNSEKQHKSERKQMLGIIALLYEKFTQLSEKVKVLESSTNENCKLERSANGLEETLHPVFYPHPRLLRNVEEKEEIEHTGDTSSKALQSEEDVGSDLKVNEDSKNVVSFSKDVEVDHIILEPLRQEIMEKQATLMDQEDPLYRKVEKVEISRVGEDKIQYQEDDSHWEKKSKKSEDSSDNSDEDSTNEDSFSHKTPEVSEDEISTDVPEHGSKMETMSSEMSEAFTTANVCELLETSGGDKEQKVDDTATGDIEHGDAAVGDKDDEVVLPKPSQDGQRNVEKVCEDVASEGRTVESDNYPGDEDSTNEGEVNIEEKIDEDKSVEFDLQVNTEFLSEVDDEMMEDPSLSEACVVEETGVKADEEIELSDKEVREKLTMTPHTDADQDPEHSLGQPESHVVANVESNNEARGELQHTVESENEVKIANDEEDALRHVEQEVVRESTSEATNISPRLGERASSLLSALKEEITGASSKEVEQSPTNLPATESTLIKK